MSGSPSTTRIITAALRFSQSPGSSSAAHAIASSGHTIGSRPSPMSAALALVAGSGPGGPSPICATDESDAPYT